MLGKKNTLRRTTKSKRRRIMIFFFERKNEIKQKMRDEIYFSRIAPEYCSISDNTI